MRPAHLILAITYAQLGQDKEARAEAAEVLRLQPDYTIAGTSRKFIPFKHSRDEEHYVDGLRKAGLPE
jgi:adenylate cyclase